MQVVAQEPKMDVEEARQALALYRAEHWYTAIQPWTFATEVVPLPIEEARALTQYREKQRLLIQYHRRLRQQELDKTDYQKINDTILTELSPEHRACLKSLTARLEPIIEKFTKSSGGAFVKLSTRSPKDAALSSETIKTLIRADILACKLPPKSQEAEIADMISFTRNCSRALRVTNAAEALELLLSSQRAFQDLLLCELMQTASKWDMQLIVREWCTIDVEWEFRAFVFNHTMTSITQYYPLCFVPEFPKKKKEIADFITSFWRQNLRELPYFQEAKDYTIDFVLQPDLRGLKVIEVNNPPPVAGTALFDWFNAADKHLIEHGPFTLRVLEAPLANPKDQIHPPIKKLINNLRGIDSPVSHKNVRCNICLARPITPLWFICRHCGDFDLCQECHDAGKEHPHPLVAKHTSDPSGTPEHDSTHGTATDQGCVIA